VANKKLQIEVTADASKAKKNLAEFGKGAKKDIQDVEKQAAKSGKSIFESMTSSANGFNEIKEAAVAIVGKIIDIVENKDRGNLP